MKRFKQRGAGLAMALGLFAAMTCAGEVVSSAAGGWFAVDSREIKDTTLEGGVIVAGETNLALQCSPSAWGAAAGGGGATVACSNATTGATGRIAENTTAESVDWTPNASGAFVLTHTVATGEGEVTLTAQFAVPVRVGDAAWAVVTNGVCAIYGTGATWAYDAAGESALSGLDGSITDVVVLDGVTGVGAFFFGGFRHVRSVTLGESVVSVGRAAFCCCHLLEDVTSASAEPVALGDYAFYRCDSLANVSFAAEPQFGTQSLSMSAGIRMNDGVPEVYPIPEITIDGYRCVLYGSANLSDWFEVTDETEKLRYNFFRIRIEPTAK